MSSRDIAESKMLDAFPDLSSTEGNDAGEDRKDDDNSEQKNEKDDDNSEQKNEKDDDNSEQKNEEDDAEDSEEEDSEEEDSEEDNSEEDNSEEDNSEEDNSEEDNSEEDNSEENDEDNSDDDDMNQHNGIRLAKWHKAINQIIEADGILIASLIPNKTRTINSNHIINHFLCDILQIIRKGGINLSDIKDIITPTTFILIKAAHDNFFLDELPAAMEVINTEINNYDAKIIKMTLLFIGTRVTSLIDMKVKNDIIYSFINDIDLKLLCHNKKKSISCMPHIFTLILEAMTDTIKIHKASRHYDESNTEIDDNVNSKLILLAKKFKYFGTQIPKDKINAPARINLDILYSYPTVCNALRDVDSDVFRQSCKRIEWEINDDKYINLAIILNIKEFVAITQFTVIPYDAYKYMYNDINFFIRFSRKLSKVDIIWYLLDSLDNGSLDDGEVIWILDRLLLTFKTPKTPKPTVDQVYVTLQIARITNPLLLHSVFMFIPSMKYYSDLINTTIKRIFEICPHKIYKLLDTNGNNNALNITKYKLIFENSQITENIKIKIISHMHRIVRQMGEFIAPLINKMNVWQLKTLFLNYPNAVYTAALFLDSWKDVRELSERIGPMWRWNQLLDTLFTIIYKINNSIISLNGEIYLRSSKTKLIVTELFKMADNVNSLVINMPEIEIYLCTLFEIPRENYHIWLLNSNIKIIASDKSSAIENTGNHTDYVMAHFDAIDYNWRGTEGMLTINSSFADIWHWLSTTACSYANYNKCIDTDSYFDSIGDGPRREFHDMIGSLIREKIFTIDAETGTLVPRTDVSIADFNTTGILLYRSILIDCVKLQLNLHPALLVLLTFPSFPSRFEWGFVKALIGDELIEIVSPRAKFTKQYLHILEDAISRFPQYADAFLAISKGWHRKSPIMLCMTPNVLSRMLCDPISSIESVLCRTRIICTPEIDTSNLYAAFKKAVTPWSVEDQAKLYKFWFGVSKVGNFGIHDSELREISGPTGLLQAHEDAPIIYFELQKCMNNGINAGVDNNEERKENGIKNTEVKWFMRVIKASTCSRQLKIPLMYNNIDDIDGMADEINYMLRNSLANNDIVSDLGTAASYTNE